jgi:hypothetical protein
MKLRQTHIASMFAIVLGSGTLALPTQANQPVTEDRHGTTLHHTMQRLASGAPVVPRAEGAIERPRGIAAGDGGFDGAAEDRHGPTLHLTLHRLASGDAGPTRTDPRLTGASAGTERGVAAGDGGQVDRSRAHWTFWDQMTNRQN